MGTMAPADDTRRSRSPARNGTCSGGAVPSAPRRASRRESPLVERSDDVTMSTSGDKGKGKAAKGKGKKKGSDDQDTPQDFEVLTLLLRTCATVSRHQSYLVQTILMGTDTRIGARGLEAEDNYKDRTYGKKGHGVGKPDSYIFFRLLDEAQQSAKEDNTDHYDKIASFFQIHPYEKTKDYIDASAIQLCRVSKTYKGDQVRISLRINMFLTDGSPNKILVEAHSALIEVIKKEGGELMDGPPPKSKEERNIQRFVTNHYMKA